VQHGARRACLEGPTLPASVRGRVRYRGPCASASRERLSRRSASALSPRRRAALPPRLSRARCPLLVRRLPPPPLRDLGEGAPGPARQLAFAELLGDADRLAEVLLGLVEAAEVGLWGPR